MKKISAWFQNKFVPVVSKLGNQRHLAAIRDAFAIFTPIIIIGAMAVLWRSVIFPQGWAVNDATLPGLFLMFNKDNGYLTGGYAHYNQFLDVMNHMMLYVQVGTINMMSLYIAFGIGYFLSTSRGSNAPVIAGLTSLACFLAVTDVMGVTGSWEGGMYWLGARGLISAIVVGLASAELFSWLSKDDKMGIKMPAGVPPAVSRAFAKLFPVMLTIIAAGLLNLIVWMPFYFMEAPLVEGTDTAFTITAITQPQLDALITAGIFKAGTSIQDVLGVTGANPVAPLVLTGLSGDQIGFVMKTVGETNITRDIIEVAVHGDKTFTSALYCGVVAPFIGLASNTGFAFGIAMLYVLLISFFWFFGLHGTNIVNGAFNPIWLILYAENAAGTANHVFVAGTFDAYIFIGGWGATLALTVATLIFGKKGSAEYEISKYSVAPGIFNINEPVTFGYPLVLNAMLVIPLFLIMPVLVFTTYAGIEWMGVPVTKALIPWTAPVGIGALLASGSPFGLILALVNFALATLMWTPFVLLMKKADHKKLEAAAMETEEGKKAAAKKAAAKA